MAASITLPNFISSPVQGKEVLDDDFIALLPHELGHFELAKAAAERIDTAIRTLPAMPSCKLLGPAADEVGKRIVEGVHRKEKQYDAGAQRGKNRDASLSE